MGHFFLVPEWFLGYDIMLEFLFAVVTMLVFFYSVRINRLLRDRKIRLFGISFLLLSASYFFQTGLNLLVLTKLNENICSALKLNDVMMINNWGVLLHVPFFLLGLATLAYMSFGVKSRAAYLSTVFLSFSALILSSNVLYAFYFIASLLLAFVVVYYAGNFIRKFDVRTFIVLLAFIFLLFGQAHFLVSVNHSLFYIIGHILELLAYLCILGGLILIAR